MKYVSHFFRFILMVVNIVVAVGFLVSAYSPYISPVCHPIWACSGLLFPLLALLNLLFVCVWLFVKRIYIFFPLLIFALGWNSLQTYFPINIIPDEPAHTQTLKILTYNTQGIPFDKATRKSAILEYLAHCDADIICLQEFIPRGGITQEEINNAMSVYPYSKQTRLKSGNVLACFSRFPIVSESQIVYDSQYNGSVQYKLLYGNDTLSVINNHLESNKLSTDDKKRYNDIIGFENEKQIKENGTYLIHKLADASAIRASQVDSVAKIIQREQNPYIIVCGDFNDSPISYAHRILSEGLTDAFAEAGNGFGFTYNQDRFYFRIDHLLIGSAFRVLQCQVDRSVNVSDHYPMWCLLGKSRE